MHNFQFRKSLVAVGLGVLLLPLALSGQARQVVSKQIAVGQSEATLHLEFDDEGRLEITFEDGSVLVDGEFVGRYEPGDALDNAWNALLGRAISLDDGALAAMLADWTVPAELAGDLADIAQDIDRALEEALTSFEVSVDTDGGSISVSIGDDSSLLRVLFNSTSRFGLLEQALTDLDGDFRVHVNEDVVIPAGSTVEGTVVVIQGNLRLAGEVRGDVIVVDGSLELLDDSRVEGEVRLADARIVRNLGTVRGGVVDVLEDERDLEAEIRDRLRIELRDEFRGDLLNELRDVSRIGRDEGRGISAIMSPFQSVFHGIGGLLQNLIAVFVLGLIGAASIAFAGDNVAAVAETARRSPGRSAMVGLAGSLLLIPVWILGVVALAVSVIGIPVAVAWLPLFPLAACAAAAMGYLAVAQNTGEWLADSDYPWTGWIRKSNPIHTVFGGLLGLMFAFMAANVISIAPFLGFLTGLLVFAGIVVTFIAMQVGFGAVLLTRAGRRRERWNTPYDTDAAWEAAMEVDVDSDPAEEAAASPEAQEKDHNDDA
jgi:hypothetical protein